MTPVSAGGGVRERSGPSVAGHDAGVAACYYPGCCEPALELEPGLPTLYCAAHRAAVVAASKAERRAR